MANILTYYQRLEIFKDWFDMWQSLFNFTQLETTFKIPPKSLYKHFKAHQELSHQNWCRLYDGMKDLFIHHHPDLFIEKN